MISRQYKIRYCRDILHERPSAAAFLAILPVVVCFLFLQKYFIKGMVDSAVK
ncbi:hypothetical protein AALA90_14405 [Lachnospiraceae bacterium 38-10]